MCVHQSPILLMPELDTSHKAPAWNPSAFTNVPSPASVSDVIVRSVLAMMHQAARRLPTAFSSLAGSWAVRPCSATMLRGSTGHHGRNRHDDADFFFEVLSRKGSHNQTSRHWSLRAQTTLDTTLCPEGNDAGQEGRHEEGVVSEQSKNSQAVHQTTRDR